MRVGIVGAGNVGSTIAYTLSMGSSVSEIVLADKNVDKAHGEVLDLRHGLPFIPYTKLEYGGLESLSNLDVVVLTAGIPRTHGESRLDLAGKNVGLFKEIIPQLAGQNKNAILLVVSNPVDIMTYVALKYSGFPKNRVFGSGNVLDSARFRSMLGHHFKVDPANVHSYILGEHGDSAFPFFSQAFIGCNPLKNMEGYDEREVREIFDRVKAVAAQVIKLKGATYYAVSLGVNKIIESIDLDKKRVMPVSTLIDRFYSGSELCLSVPAVVGKNGIEKILHVPFNEEEKTLFQASVEKIAKTIEEVGLSGG
ncbi:MAG TPA: L-lactate dehydrogenase [Candidatus Altiarchaeales archaeon]|nr:L-lactate dehydrogenase [Candidatus Altiarchaeales archaeon]